ncbi:hypothetical protein [Streptomyces sp. NPDC006285]|uniref:hypothetical protein n=1 Tax=Streptomyces sp. NPDC006285 TaxID=3364742 RepID=UPI00369D5760
MRAAGLRRLVEDACVVGRTLGAAMGSLIEELEERELTARKRVEELEALIAE